MSRLLMDFSGSGRQTAHVSAPLEVIAMGRAGIDLYPTTASRPLSEVDHFAKFLGGSAANVAVAAARFGRTSALISRVADDPFGAFVVSELTGFGVSTQYVSAVPSAQTPVTFCELFPPDDFPLYFYAPSAPYFAIEPAELDLEAIASAPVFWTTLTGLSQEPSRAAHYAAWQIRPSGSHTVLDLDFRARFWNSRDEAMEQARLAIGYASVVIGNLEECQIATGQSDAEAAARALLDAGAHLAIVKLGPDGVLGMSADERVGVPALRMEVRNGLGAGDAFGGAVAHGLLAEWPLEKVLTFANAAGAIVVSRLACASAMPTAAEVEQVLSHPQPAMRSVTDQVARVRRLRAEVPELIEIEYQRRDRRDVIHGDGRLLLIAADHPARGALGIRDDRLAMASREVMLERIAVALSHPGVDGVLATADLVEDLLLMGLLDGKIVIGSMNRGGIQGSTFQFDDRFTGFDARTIDRLRLNGGKMLCRIGMDDRATANTLESIGKAVTELNQARLMALIEPFLAATEKNGSENDLSTEAVIRSVAIASGLGATSAYTWLKLPVVDRMEEVMAATTLPTLLLGGESSADAVATYRRWEQALRLPGVRGLVLGRPLLYPVDGDVTAAVETAVSLVHGSSS